MHGKHSGEGASSPLPSHVHCLREGELSKIPSNSQGFQEGSLSSLILLYGGHVLPHSPQPAATHTLNFTHDASPVWMHRLWLYCSCSWTVNCLNTIPVGCICTSRPRCTFLLQSFLSVLTLTLPTPPPTFSQTHAQSRGQGNFWCFP